MAQDYLQVGQSQYWLPSLQRVTGNASACSLIYADFEIELTGADAAAVWQWWQSKGGK